MLFDLEKKIKNTIVHKMKNSDEILFSDTTLRDGEQTPGVFFGSEDKINIAKCLVELGVHSIDVGFPSCSEGEKKAIRAVVENIKGPIMTTLCRAKKQDIDDSYEVLKNVSSLKRGISIFLGSSPQQREKLGKTKQEIIEMAKESINYAKKYFKIISFSPEDASRTEPDFLVELYNEAVKLGVSNIGFTDTVGILDPEETVNYVKYINENVNGIEDVLFAIHFHNDLGMAVANSLAAIKTGYVNIFQGTVGGIGERSGNTAIEPVVMALKLKDYGKKTKINMEKFQEVSQLVQKLSGIKFSPFTPVIGKNIFRTEAGIHQDGILKNPETYEIFSPESVGVDKRELIIGKHSGRNAIFSKLRDLGYQVGNDGLSAEIKKYCDENGIIEDSKLIDFAREYEKKKI